MKSILFAAEAVMFALFYAVLGAQGAGEASPEPPTVAQEFRDISDSPDIPPSNVEIREDRAPVEVGEGGIVFRKKREDRPEAQAKDGA